MPDHDATAIDLLYADDLHVGDNFDLGTHHVTLEEIVEFASRWDPQGFHIDEATAAAGMFGGIIASGIHSMAIFQRLAVTAQYDRWAVIAGRTLQDVQLLSPVRPDMTLRGRIRIEAVEPRGTGRALVHQACSLLHEDVVVLSYRGSVYVRTRPTNEV